MFRRTRVKGSGASKEVGRLLVEDLANRAVENEPQRHWGKLVKSLRNNKGLR